MCRPKRAGTPAYHGSSLKSTLFVPSVGHGASHGEKRRRTVGTGNDISDATVAHGLAGSEPNQARARCSRTGDDVDLWRLRFFMKKRQERRVNTPDNDSGCSADHRSLVLGRPKTSQALYDGVGDVSHDREQAPVDNQARQRKSAKSSALADLAGAEN